jgi:hypothetical protein
MTPFQVVYGRPPPPMIPFQAGSARVAVVDCQLRDRDTFLAEIKDRLLQVQALMKTAHDRQHRQVEYQVGDWVWLRLNQRAAATIRSEAPSKLAPKFFGPYEVLEKVGVVSYRLHLPPKSRIHNVFHAAFLKKIEGTGAPTAATNCPRACCAPTGAGASSQAEQGLLGPAGSLAGPQCG